jgi:hypothetical protein
MSIFFTKDTITFTFTIVILVINVTSPLTTVTFSTKATIVPIPTQLCESGRFIFFCSHFITRNILLSHNTGTSTGVLEVAQQIFYRNQA